MMTPFPSSLKLPGFVRRLPVFAQGYAEASALTSAVAGDRLRVHGFYCHLQLDLLPDMEKG